MDGEQADEILEGKEGQKKLLNYPYRGINPWLTYYFGTLGGGAWDTERVGACLRLISEGNDGSKT